MTSSVVPSSVDERRQRAARFAAVYQQSVERPEEFWAEAAAEIDWVKPWERVLDDSRAPFYRWFAGGQLNTCYNALDRHVERGRAEQLALIYDSPVTDTVATFTYRELRDAVATFAGALAAQGVERGDRVVIYMPMVPEAAIAMLACARLGAIHSVVFGGFAANELAGRIEDAQPKVVVSASCGIEPGRLVAYKPLLDAAIDLVQAKPDACIIVQRPQLEAELQPGRDITWEQAMADAEPADCVAVEATDPLYILYTSGHHRPAEGDRARQRRSRGRAEVVDEEPLRRRSGRGVLGGVRRRLGRGPFIHRLRAAVSRLHDRAVRGQARRDTGPRSVLASDLGAWREHDVHGADSIPGDSPAGSRTATTSSATTCPASARCSSRASGAIRRRCTGRRRRFMCP